MKFSGSGWARGVMWMLGGRISKQTNLFRQTLYTCTYYINDRPVFLTVLSSQYLCYNVRWALITYHVLHWPPLPCTELLYLIDVLCTELLYLIDVLCTELHLTSLYFVKISIWSHFINGKGNVESGSRPSLWTLTVFAPCNLLCQPCHVSYLAKRQG